MLKAVTSKTRQKIFYQPSSANTPPLFQFVPSVKLQKKRSCSTTNCCLSNIKTLTRPGELLEIKMRVVEKLPVPFLLFIGVSLYLPNGQSIKEKFPLGRVFLLWHSAGTHGTRGIAYGCNSWGGMPAPSLGADCLSLAPERCWNGRTWAQHCQKGMFGLAVGRKGMPQGCPNLCYWHYSLGTAQSWIGRKTSEFNPSFPNESSICHKEQLMDIERK